MREGSYGPKNGALMLGWSISVTAHLLILVFCALLLFPAAGKDGDDMTIEVSLGEEVSVEDVMIAAPPTPQPFDSPTDPVDAPDLDKLLKQPVAQTGQAPGTSGGSAGRSGSGTGDGSSTTFFGTSAYGDRFVYILDMSSSMGTKRSSSTRFNYAVSECLKSIDKLRSDQFFYVVMFAYKTRRMFDEGGQIPVMVPATKANKERLRKWLISIRPSGGTDPREAVYLALTMEPSAVFLLSDGEFNGQKKKRKVPSLDGNPSVEDVVAKHNSAEAPIHTVAYEAPRAKARMQALASKSKGQFDYVEPLEKPKTRRTSRPNPFANAGRTKTKKKVDPRALAAKKTANDKMAKDWLDKAMKLETEGEYKAASLRYRSLVARFPETSFANVARERLKAPHFDARFDAP